MTFDIHSACENPRRLALAPTLFARDCRSAPRSGAARGSSAQSVALLHVQPEISTPMFSRPCPFFVRSSAPERKSTPLFSCACALLCKNTGVGGDTPDYGTQNGART